MKLHGIERITEATSPICEKLSLKGRVPIREIISKRKRLRRNTINNDSSCI